MLALAPCGCTQFFVQVRVDKSRVGVVLHEAVGFPLSREKTGGTGVMEVIDDGVSGVEIQVYLFRSFTFNELLVNAVGFGHHVFMGCECPEIFTGCPKLNVLFTELRLQEDTKCSFPIFMTK